MRKIKSTNPELLTAIRSLRKTAVKNDANIWRQVAGRLSSSRRNQATVNVSHLNRYSDEGETVIVPGKVLGAGKINHPLHVAAFSFSNQAKWKISEAKGKCFSILELLKDNPKGSNVRIME
jgi:large subunit ribosomal protein L18e